MKTLLIIGIGAGHPEHITVQAARALARVDVFFLMDKGDHKGKLNALRKEILERHATPGAYRVVEVRQPERPAGPDYRTSVNTLNARKRAAFERLLDDEVADGECAGVLVWGDPSLYDSTLRIVEAIAANGARAVRYEVFPGVTSIQALTAAHRITLNSIAGAVQITTGRRLAAGMPEGVDTVVVMLDAQDSFKALVGQDLDIYWGAYVGTADEVLLSGRLDDVAQTIADARQQARSQHGWIMDSYLLRRRV
ncbi:precorrin-6A synthase (deacetylating) [Pseudomonas sp. CFBP 13727]|uniref:precorrin-6A synthase (deacetylating) n=1 Tax=Pseudomonas sp. CFBP 13727 TaxID=2775295 RepID=UPI00178442E8|nr:precorrin-6A synthase (deacetylating) [Pseudomonas sp. CFBP 13727]MBD8621963.1 precorrin-6A synthase (deacetylating) [Pseudomonas sp. CFBP 13727]